MNVTIGPSGIEEFTTRRLVGRSMTAGDEAFVNRLHADPAIMERHGGTRSAEISNRFLAANLAHWKRFGFGLWTVAPADDSANPIGRAGLRWDRLFDGSMAVDVSCLLVGDRWGEGLGTETANAVTAIGLHLGLPLVTGCQADNEIARRVIDTVGFTHWSDYWRNGREWSKYRWPDEAERPAEVGEAGMITAL